MNRQDAKAAKEVEPLGMSVPAIGSWLNILEATTQVLMVPPYFDNLGKRIIKSPKVYISDSRLACHLLGIETRAELERSPFLGSLFEGFVASEILKSQAHRGARRQLFHFRDQQGLEVDFLIPGKQGSVTLVEVKATRTVKPAMAEPLSRLGTAWKGRSGSGSLRQVVIHRESRAPVASHALAPGVQALSLLDFVAATSGLSAST